MRIAIPIAQGQLCLHFGHCEEFLMADIEDKKIKNTSKVSPPPHAPGVIPQFLNEQNVDCIIAGGMGSRAQQFFNQYNIKVITGAQGNDPLEIINAYLNGTLATGANVCDH